MTANSRYFVVKILTIILVILLIPAVSNAESFIVSTNSTGGTGSLRQAIADAAANGSATKDSIIFSIPDTSRAGRTIELQSDLPDLTSNLVIDGSTQQGSFFGKSNSKVILLNTRASTSIKMLRFTNANDIEIYGLYFLNTYWAYTSSDPRAIDFLRSNNVVIGRAGKGNYFRGFSYPIHSYSTVRSDSCRNLVIQSNLIGLNEAGGLQGSGTIGQIVYSPYYALKLFNVYDIKIGGINVEDGNHILGSYCEIKSNIITNTGTISILNNKFNLDINGNIDLGGSSGNPLSFRIYGNGGYPHEQSGYKIIYRNNKHNGSVDFYGVRDSVIIQGSKIFVPSFLNSAEYNRVKISGSSGKGIIGGNHTGEPNEIFSKGTDFDYFGISSPYWFQAVSIYSEGITISRNSIYCSAYYASGIYKYSASPYIRIDSTAVDFVRGKATPLSKIEIFEDDECPACEGKRYLGSSTSAADSTWSYAGSFNKVVVATVTEPGGSTSSFSTPEVDVSKVKVTPSSCGKSNGSIVGMKAKGNNRVEWTYRKWNGTTWVEAVYSNSLDIYNLPPGRYFFHSWLGTTCRSYPRDFIIDSLPSPKADTTFRVITHPTCGKFNGSIRNIGVNNNPQLKIYWLKDGNQVIPANLSGSVVSLNNAGAGKYKLFVVDSIGGCTDSSAVFELVNQSGPTLSTTTLQIKNATCGNRNGAITGIRIMNATGTQYIRWIDTAGTTVGTSLDLINIGSGKYRLKYKDAAACDTIVTSYFVVGNDGAINIDTTSIVIKASKCSSPTGSISNLIVYGAESYTWYNASGNQIVSQTVALSTAPSGSYSLTASNSIGCSVTSPVFVIPQTVFSPVTIRSIDSSHAFCDLNNGYIKPNFLTDTSKHSFKWTNLGLGITVSQNSFANQLATGIYSLVAIDTNYCSGEVYRTELKQIGKPDFDYSVMKIADDTCDLGVGQILNIGVTGGAGDYRWAWSKNNITITGNGNSLSKLNNGVYVAKVKDRNGCEVSSNIINIYNKKASLPIPVTDDYFILRNSQAKIDIRNFAAGNYLLFLERTSTMPIATTSTAVITTPPVLADKLYYLQYQKGSCLSDLKPIEVKVFDNSEIRLPNAFSPNNDGINDYWIPEMRGIINKIELRVYNRYGQQIFFTRNVKQGWDGKVDSKLVPMGTYYWLLSAFDHLSKPIYSSGSVTVLR